MIRLLGMLLLVVGLAICANAQEIPGDKQAALRMGNQGIELFDQKRFAEALDRFLKASWLDPSDPLHKGHAAFAYWSMGKVDEAVEWFKKAVDTAVEMPNDAVEVKDGKGGLTKESRQEIIGLYNDKITEVLEKETNRNRPALSQWAKVTDRALALYAAGEYANGLRLAREALRLSELHFGKQSYVTLTSMEHVALALDKLGRYGEALILHQEAYENTKSLVGRAHESTLQSLNNLTVNYLLQGFFVLASAELSTGIRLAMRAYGPAHEATIALRFTAANLSLVQGAYVEAEETLEEIKAHLVRTFDASHPAIGPMENSLAYLYIAQGRFQKGAERFEKIIRQGLFRGCDALAAMNNLAVAYNHLQRYQEARRVLENAINSEKGAAGEDLLGILRANLGGTYLNLGEQDLAGALLEDDARQALKVFRGNPKRLKAVNNLAVYYLLTGKPAKARELLQKARADAQPLLGAAHPDVLLLQANMAPALQVLGKVTEARRQWQEYLHESTLFLEEVLLGTNARTRQSYLARFAILDNALLSFVAESKSNQDARLAFSYALRRKGMRLRIAAKVHTLAVAAKSDSSIGTKARRLYDLRSQIAHQTLTARGDASGFENLIVQIEKLEAELGRSVWRSESQELNPIRVSPMDAVKRLPSDSVLVDYLVYRPVNWRTIKEDEPHLMAVLVLPKQAQVFRLIPLGQLKQISQLILAYRKQVTSYRTDSDRQLDRTAKELYRLLWLPMEPLLNGNHKVYVVLDGPLHLLPFAALVDSVGNYLIESHDLILLSSSSDLLTTWNQGSKRASVIFAGPNYDFPESHQTVDNCMRTSAGTSARDLSSLHFGPLCGAFKEGQEVRALLACIDKDIEIYDGDNATEDRLRRVERPRILHLATHGFFLLAPKPTHKSASGPFARGVELVLYQDATQIATHADLPTFATPDPLVSSGVALTGANPGRMGRRQPDGTDGLVTALEALSLNLSGTELSVLSACDTGVGQIEQGEGLFGLRWAFQKAGARAVLASLWSISDEGTRAFMNTFYKHYLTDPSPHDALHHAQLVSIGNSSWKHPFYWAPFTVVGAP